MQLLSGLQFGISYVINTRVGFEINPFRTAKPAINGNDRLKLMSKIETTSKVSLKFPSRINLGRGVTHARLALDFGNSP